MGKVQVDLTEDGQQEPADASAATIVAEDGPDGGKKALPDRAALLPDGSVRLRLLKPVTLTIKGATGTTREEVYNDLTFTELTGADMRAIMQASDERKPIIGLARATGISASVMTVLFDRMGTRDINAASACISFLSE